MPNILEQDASENDDAYRSKIDPQYLANIPSGQAKTYFQNNPSKRLPEYLNDDYQGQLFDKLINCKDEFYKENYLIWDTINSSVEKAKLVLSIPDIYQQTGMFGLIKVVLRFPEETTEIFMENASKYKNFDGVVDFISREGEYICEQDQMLIFVLENPPFHKMFNEEHFMKIVEGGGMSYESISDKTGTEGQLIEIILEYAKKYFQPRQKLTSSLLSAWAHQTGNGDYPYYCSYYSIDTILESSELVEIFTGEDLAQLFLSELGFRIPLNEFEEKKLLSKFLEAETMTLEQVLKKSTNEKLNQLIELKLIERQKVTNLTSSSQFFDSARTENTIKTDDDIRLHLITKH